MKNFFTLTLCFLTLSLTAQEACPNPYDGNGDGNVSIGDFLEMLSVFGDTDADSDGVWDSLDACVDLAACNFANDTSEPCTYIDVLGVCGGGCEGDGDDDGICDSEDDCVGVLDECGVCNGPGPTEVVIESITILIDSVYAEAIDNWFVFEIGADTVFNYTCAPEFPPLTDANIHEVVDLWLSDEASAEAIYGHISDWDVSSVTDMNSLFQGATYFNGDLSSWDVSSVTDVENMFDGASSFNGDISDWDVSSVTNISQLFRSASSFNGDLSSWDVSSVTSMRIVFFQSEFNGDLSSWDVSSVTDMHAMFYHAYSFNGDLSSWDVLNVTLMSQMFDSATSFNGNLSSWDVSSVTTMESMFAGASSFNGDISSWDVSSESSMINMFYGASALSEENQCLIHTSFSSNENWALDWSEFCPAVFNSCGDDIGHEGYDYSTVQIGDQCWFSENLNTSKYNNGDDIPNIQDGGEWISLDQTETGAWAYYNNDPDYSWGGPSYTKLYNWYAVNDTRSLCPSGWHVPSDGEWQTLEMFLGMSESEANSTDWRGTDEGYQMKADYGWGGESIYQGSNSSGFSALPGGYRSSSGVFDVEYRGNFWSSSPNDSGAWTRSLDINGYDVRRLIGDPVIGISIRCIKD